MLIKITGMSSFTLAVLVHVYGSKSGGNVVNTWIIAHSKLSPLKTDCPGFCGRGLEKVPPDALARSVCSLLSKQCKPHGKFPSVHLQEFLIQFRHKGNIAAVARVKHRRAIKPL